MPPPSCTTQKSRAKAAAERMWRSPLFTFSPSESVLRFDRPKRRIGGFDASVCPSTTASAPPLNRFLNPNQKLLLCLMANEN